MSSLDQTLIDDAAPAGSFRYFSLLYTPQERRAALAAAYLIESEIRSSARSPSHDVAHTRLQWWREEIVRLRSGSAQHPATRALGGLSADIGSDVRLLLDVVTAAEQDLACVSYEDERETSAYLRRSGGSIAEFAATLLSAPATLRTEARVAANELGIAIRKTEIVRDLRQDAHDGRVYFALPALARAQVEVHELKQPTLSASARALLLNDATQTLAQFNASAATLSAAERINLRPLMVLASLHARLLVRLSRDLDKIPERRIDLGPLEKVWAAWRAARKSTL